VFARIVGVETGIATMAAVVRAGLWVEVELLAGFQILVVLVMTIPILNMILFNK